MTARQSEMCLAAVGASLLDALDFEGREEAFAGFSDFLDGVLTAWGSRWMVETFF